MISLASIIERFEPDYLRQYGACSLPSHAHALAAMQRCRTQLAPRMLAQCGACGQQRVVPHPVATATAHTAKHMRAKRGLRASLHAK